MPKFLKETHDLKNGTELETCMFMCPGCKEHHVVNTKVPDGRSEPCWAFNNDVEKPTISPSVLTGSVNFTSRRCHSFIMDGKIRFLDDCFHELKGQTVELPDFDEEVK